MSVRLHHIVPVIAVLLAAPPAIAADQERVQQLEQRREKLRQKWERQFREADRDGDRRLSRSEAVAAGLPRAVLDRFDEIDADGDGGLSPEELLAAQEKRVRAAASPAESDRISETSVSPEAPAANRAE